MSENDQLTGSEAIRLRTEGIRAEAYRAGMIAALTEIEEATSLRWASLDDLRRAINRRILALNTAAIRANAETIKGDAKS